MHPFIKKALTFITASALAAQAVCITAFAKPDWPSDTGIMAEAGIIMDMDSKAVLFGQNIHVGYPPASITKLLTALVVAENCEMDETVTFSHDAIYNVESGSSNSLELEEGDTLSVEESLYAMLLISSNPAANALAEHTAGSREAFVEMMNAKLTELGCAESHFANPSGLNDDNQYVSAYDMALIATAAFQNETVLAISSSKNHTVPATSKRPNGSDIQMEHRLLVTTDTSSQFYLEGAVAGKTGYTSKAGNTLVTYAKRDGRNIVSVILKGTQPQYYMDAKTIMNFGFSSFHNAPVNGNETFLQENQQLEVNGAAYPASDLSLDEQAVITLPGTAVFSDAERTLATDLPAGHPADAVAMLQYTYNDRAVGSSYIRSASLSAAPAAPAASGNANGVADGSGGGADADTSTQPQGADHSDENGKADPATPSPRQSTPIPWLPILVVLAILALAAGGIFFFQYRQRKEREALARRKERRRQRLLESGVSEEEFAALVAARMKEQAVRDNQRKRR